MSQATTRVANSMVNTSTTDNEVRNKLITTKASILQKGIQEVGSKLNELSSGLIKGFQQKAATEEAKNEPDLLYKTYDYADNLYKNNPSKTPEELRNDLKNYVYNELPNIDGEKHSIFYTSALEKRLPSILESGYKRLDTGLIKQTIDLQADLAKSMMTDTYNRVASGNNDTKTSLDASRNLVLSNCGEGAKDVMDNYANSFNGGIKNYNAVKSIEDVTDEKEQISVLKEKHPDVWEEAYQEIKMENPYLKEITDENVKSKIFSKASVEDAKAQYAELSQIAFNVNFSQTKDEASAKLAVEEQADSMSVALTLQRESKAINNSFDGGDYDYHYNIENGTINPATGEAYKKEVVTAINQETRKMFNAKKEALTQENDKTFYDSIGSVIQNVALSGDPVSGKAIMSSLENSGVKYELLDDDNKQVVSKIIDNQNIQKALNGLDGEVIPFEVYDNLPKDIQDKIIRVDNAFVVSPSSKEETVSKEEDVLKEAVSDIQEHKAEKKYGDTTYEFNPNVNTNSYQFTYIKSEKERLENYALAININSQTRYLSGNVGAPDKRIIDNGSGCFGDTILAYYKNSGEFKENAEGKFYSVKDGVYTFTRKDGTEFKVKQEELSSKIFSVVDNIVINTCKETGRGREEVWAEVSSKIERDAELEVVNSYEKKCEELNNYYNNLSSSEKNTIGFDKADISADKFYGDAIKKNVDNIKAVASNGGRPSTSIPWDNNTSAVQHYFEWKVKNNVPDDAFKAIVNNDFGLSESDRKTLASLDYSKYGQLDVHESNLVDVVVKSFSNGANEPYLRNRVILKILECRNDPNYSSNEEQLLANAASQIQADSSVSIEDLIGNKVKDKDISSYSIEEGSKYLDGKSGFTWIGLELNSAKSIGGITNEIFDYNALFGGNLEGDALRDTIRNLGLQVCGRGKLKAEVGTKEYDEEYKKLLSEKNSATSFICATTGALEVRFNQIKWLHDNEESFGRIANFDFEKGMATMESGAYYKFIKSTDKFPTLCDADGKTIYFTSKDTDNEFANKPITADLLSKDYAKQLSREVFVELAQNYGRDKVLESLKLNGDELTLSKSTKYKGIKEFYDFAWKVSGSKKFEFVLDETDENVYIPASKNPKDEDFGGWSMGNGFDVTVVDDKATYKANKAKSEELSTKKLSLFQRLKNDITSKEPIKNTSIGEDEVDADLQMMRDAEERYKKIKEEKKANKKAKK